TCYVTGGDGSAEGTPAQGPERVVKVVLKGGRGGGLLWGAAPWRDGRPPAPAAPPPHPPPPGRLPPPPGRARGLAGPAGRPGRRPCPRGPAGPVLRQRRRHARRAAHRWRRPPPPQT